MLPAIVVFPVTYKLPIVALPCAIDMPPAVMLAETSKDTKVPSVVMFGCAAVVSVPETNAPPMLPPLILPEVVTVPVPKLALMVAPDSK